MVSYANHYSTFIGAVNTFIDAIRVNLGFPGRINCGVGRCNSVSKRFSVTVPDEIYEDLKRWADNEGRTRGDLAGFLIELSVKRKFKAKYPDAEDPGTDFK